MTPETWQRIKGVFDAAAELPAAEREAFLESVCGTEPAMLAEVRSLLASLDDAGDFIEAPPGPPPETAFTTGVSIGPYRIVQVIGEGGMAWSIRPFA